MTGKYVAVWAKYSSKPEKFIEFFQKMVWLINFGFTVHEVLRLEISKKTAESAKK